MDESKYNAFKEDLAGLLHVIWSEWSMEISKAEGLSEERLERWRTFWIPYGDLPDPIKETDLELADRVMKVLQKWKLLEVKGSGSESSSKGLEV